MKIYTKTGDQGETALFGGMRVSKDHIRTTSYGTLDETNAVVGMASAASSCPEQIKSMLLQVQEELFRLGAELATPSDQKLLCDPIDQVSVTRLEKQMDQMDEKLPPLKSFILPGGTECAASLHLARTVIRRAERLLVTLNRHEPLRSEVMMYVNRLSDFFFMAARYANFLNKKEDIPWES
ncbi:MAG: ATP:cob(I)alamin adenosyltransferase [Bdellovibrionaceae bacterium]|nr:ATP:cob(I)alamin adenosyltransferase [Pseudobdellovibrionaceae bacterium]|tara:strand:- start:4986 stop:5528 length:543 start_codon:yes stop_codon:yes gene_type:complete